MRTKVTLVVLAALVGLACVMPAKAEAPKGKVKVFLLAGQSNMQGKGSADHLKELVKSQPEKYGWTMNGDNWAEREDVWVYFNGTSGRLKVGYTHPAGRVGPELGFGKVVGDAIAEPVILLKACWGGQSLAVDFRSPSAGKWDKEFNPDDGVGWKPGTIGWAYKAIFLKKHEALDDLGKTFPELAGREYEIAGLVWFQGWNDLINGPKAAEYQSNLTFFIKDIRKDLKLPNLPFVIAIVGNDGENAKGGQLVVRQAQAAVAELPEFKGTVAAVPTAPFWDPTPHGEKGFHYNGSASFYIQAGEAFGKAMLGLLKIPEAKATK